MTSCCWLVVMGSERFASPIMGIFCGGLNAYCMRIWPLFLRTSGSSGVLKALLLERNRQLSCNPKKKKNHANQTEAAQWCREGAGPTAPWDGPSFWATGTSASRGVALLFKPSPLLSRATSAAVDPNGRFVAVKCDLSGSQITIASVYAPVERQERTPFFHSSLLPALPAGTPLALGGDWNCVASDQDLIGGQPGTRQAGFQHGLLPLQQALGLQDAFRHLHPQAREFTHTATSGSSSARIDRWLVTDSLLPDISAATVSDLRPSDHYGVSLSISPAAAPPRGPGVWAMPPSIVTHPAFKTLMTAQIQAFMLACPVSAAISRAARWDQLKTHIQDVARNYCSTFHAGRTRQLRALRARADLARAAYLADPTSQPALFFFFFFFLGGKDIHYTSATITTSRVCDVHHKPKRPKLTTHLEWFRHES